MATQPTQEENFQLELAINNYVTQKQNLHTILKESSLTYDVDTSGMENYNFNVDNQETMSNSEEKRLFTEKMSAFKSYFNENFNQNTKLLQQYRNNINTINEDLEAQSKKIEELSKQRKSLSTDTSTQIRNIKESKRALEQEQYYQHLYVVVGLIQLLNLLILGLMYNGIIPKMTGLLLTFIVVLGLTIYITYYVFFNTHDRDVVSFNKFKFKVDKDYVSNLPACGSTSKEQQAKTRQLNNELTNSVNNVIDNNDNTQCEVELTEDTRTDYLNKYNNASNNSSTTTSTTTTTTTSTTTPPTTPPTTL